MKKHSLFFLLFLILFSKIVLAQEVENFNYAILEAIIGKLPDACYYAFDDICIKCLAIAKIYPLILFAAILWIVFSIMMHHILPPKEEVKTLQLPKKEERIVALLSVVFSLLFLHSQNVATNLQAITIWGGFFLLIAIFLAGGIASHNWVVFIIFLVALILYFVYVYPIITGVIGYYNQMCT